MMTTSEKRAPCSATPAFLPVNGCEKLGIRPATAAAPRRAVREAGRGVCGRRDGDRARGAAWLHSGGSRRCAVVGWPPGMIIHGRALTRRAIAILGRRRSRELPGGVWRVRGGSIFRFMICRKKLKKSPTAAGGRDKSAHSSRRMGGEEFEAADATFCGRRAGAYTGSVRYG